MWIVTGGAGFIGSALLWKLNREGVDDILVVDVLESSEKWKNLRGKKFSDYQEADAFLARVRSGKMPKLEGIVHLGACSSTTETNASYLIQNNYEYTKTLAEWALSKKVRFIYASSAATYGDGSLGYKTDAATTRRLKPLNMYGYSKQMVDLWALQRGVLGQLVGIKFFNVFGPNEYHKGDMRSVVAKAYEQIRLGRKVQLFKSYRPDYKNGEQVRDFLYVKDAVSVVYAMMESKTYGGLYNLGAGLARSWNDLVKAIYQAMDRPSKIEYIDMPETLRAKYQYHTLADMTWFNRKTMPSMMSLEEGVKDYVHNYLMKEDPYL